MCGAELHKFIPAGPEEHSCRRCGLVEPHALVTDARWEDWGGWDSIGPWRAQENEYLICRRCGWEEFVKSTGRIQV